MSRPQAPAVLCRKHVFHGVSMFVSSCLCKLFQILFDLWVDCGLSVIQYFSAGDYSKIGTLDGYALLTLRAQHSTIHVRSAADFWN